ncbi:MAG TPA: RodZ domain-containing protein, partial [Thermodesulfobacteriota bacterium]|nr:RodZ domain-containing protein [Thermodesulfobacteriota bacterium]
TPFVKGFIQAYCRYLGLDAQDAILRYEAYMRSLAENETPALKQTPPPAPYPSLSIIAIAVAALLVIAGGVYTVISKKQTSPTPESFSDKETRGQASSQIDHPPIPRDHSENGVEAKKEEPSLPIKSEGQSNITLNSSVSKTSVGPLILIIEAAKPAWIKAEIDGQNPFEVSLKEGEKVKWNAKEKFSVLIGNAGGVNVIFNGKSLGRLGDEGKVVKLILPPDKAGEGPAIKILNP